MYIKKSDILLILSVLTIIFVIWFYNNIIIASSDSNKFIDIYVSDNLYGSYTLDSDNVIDVITDNNISNIVTIHNNKAFMTYASCPDGLCLKQKSIFNNNESICCLPNSVLIVVHSDNTGEYDAITK